MVSANDSAYADCGDRSPGFSEGLKDESYHAF